MGRGETHHDHHNHQTPPDIVFLGDTMTTPHKILLCVVAVLAVYELVAVWAAWRTWRGDGWG